MHAQTIAMMLLRVAMPASLAAATSLADAASASYRIEPFTSQQLTVKGDVWSAPNSARFLTLMLSNAGADEKASYEPRTPRRSGGSPPWRLRNSP